ncbi:MAG: T9SS type A sorting domain-containing protein [Aureispira sp.]
MKLLVTIAMFFLPVLGWAQWVQNGSNIDGTQAGEQFGHSIDINANGTTVLVGAYQNSNNGTHRGQMRVFEFNGSAWLAKGNVIEGNAAFDDLGYSVSMSANGNVIAAGAPKLSQFISVTGYAKVLEWNGTNWVQRGQDIETSVLNGKYATAISLNADGSILAVKAAPFTGPVYIQVFQWDGTNWNQLGSDISGMNRTDDFASTMDLNATGTALVVGITESDDPQDNIGRIRVYEWDGTNWTTKGTDIIGENQFDFFGKGVSINDSATVIAAGARAGGNSAGYAKVYEWDGIDWVQKGAKLEGNAGDFFGEVTAISTSGDVLAVGTLVRNYVKLFKFDGTNWIESDSLLGQPNDVLFGKVLALNQTGNTLAVAATTNNSGGLGVGCVRVFQDQSNIAVQKLAAHQFEVDCFPNPSNEILYLQSAEVMHSVEVIAWNGTVVLSTSLNNRNYSIYIGNLPNGIYTVQAKANQEVFVTKIVKY